MVERLKNVILCSPKKYSKKNIVGIIHTIKIILTGLLLIYFDSS